MMTAVIVTVTVMTAVQRSDSMQCHYWDSTRTSPYDLDHFYLRQKHEQGEGALLLFSK